MLDPDELTLLGANLLAYGALVGVGAFLICVPIFFPLGFIFGALDFALFGGVVVISGWLAWRFRRFFAPKR